MHRIRKRRRYFYDLQKEGCLIRFSHATAEEAESDPSNFLKKMSIIEMPPDCRFVLRFSGKVYHQFGPKDPNFDAVYAISVHTDEAGGLSGTLLEEVLRNNASIPIRTEPLSKATQEVLRNTELVRQYGKFYSMTSEDRMSGAIFPDEWTKS